MSLEKVCIVIYRLDLEYKDIFSTYDPVEILEKITLFTGKKVHPGETLIFLDEIQDCPRAIIALRYFHEEMRDLHIIGAGSLIEFTLKNENFRMPVGRVQYLYMFPLSFGEFLEALGEKTLYNYTLQIQNLIEIPDSLHNKLIGYIRKYFIIGGMPAVVKEYRQKRDIFKCQKIQHSIIIEVTPKFEYKFSQSTMYQH